jgi:hypothetical protein
MTYYVGDNHATLHRQFPREIWSITLAGIDITLRSTKSARLFCVQYGKQADYDLPYGRACAKLGEAIMHALQCEGRLDP